mmetsp:Transcript_115672/g.274918  ORF Transcript_115672/g.274918 Transcript_115672/m.274918 type:complete len:334 (+) Transcript_115672:889-1890(+)
MSHLLSDDRRRAVHVHVRLERHLLLDLPPLVFQRPRGFLFLVLLLLPRLAIGRKMPKVLSRVPPLHLVVVQGIGVHDFAVHRACSHAAAVVEPPAPRINLHQVVGVQLVRLVAEAEGDTPMRPVVELHPGVDVDLVHTKVWTHIDGVAVELLHLPDGQRIEPGDVVEAKLVHGTGTAGAICEDQKDFAQCLVPLRHHHGADIQEGRHRVAGPDNLQQVHGWQQLLRNVLLSNVRLSLRVLGADAAFERFLDDVVATACVEDIVVRDLQQRPAVHLVLQRLVAGVHAVHVGIDTVLAIHHRSHVEPADGLEKVEPMEDTGGAMRVMRERRIRIV